MELDAQLWLDGPTSPPGRVGGAARELFRAMDTTVHRNRAFPSGNADGDAWSRLGDLDLPVVLATGDLDCGYLQHRTEELLARIPAPAAPTCPASRTCRPSSGPTSCGRSSRTRCGPPEPWWEQGPTSCKLTVRAREGAGTAALAQSARATHS